MPETQRFSHNSRNGRKTLMRYDLCYVGQVVKTRSIETSFGTGVLFDKEILLRIIHLNPETHTVDVCMVEDYGYYNYVLPHTLKNAKLHLPT